MRPVLVIEQDERLEGLGVLGERLAEAGVPHRRFQAWREAMAPLRAADFAGIVAMGGNMHAWDVAAFPFLGDEGRLLAEEVETDVPVLGICLGAQVLARSLGAEVRPGETAEIGWLEVETTAAGSADPLLGDAGRRIGVMQWHVDVFDLPRGATLLATSEASRHQAFRLGRAWGVQFHPEVDAAQFEVWFARHRQEAAELGLDEAGLLDEVRTGSGGSARFRERLFDAFLGVAAGPSAR